MFMSNRGDDTLVHSEPSFGVNNFNKPKYTNESETVAHAILNILFGKPGFFPSMPNLGLNIQERIYSFWDEIDETRLKAEIVAQCSELRQYADDGTLDVIKSSYEKKPLLIIVLPVIVKNIRENLAIAITQNSEGAITYNYTYHDEFI